MRVRSGGYTLIELLIVIGIVGIMVAVSVPGLLEMGAHSRLVTVTNNISRVFKVARGEAVKRRLSATIQMVGNEWQARVGDEVITSFTNNDDIVVTPLPTLTITPTGESSPAMINVAGGHPGIGDRCIRILLSGQSVINKEGC